MDGASSSLSSSACSNATIFSENLDGSPSYYSLSADPTGNSLVYGNDTLNPTAATSLSWAVPGGLVGQLLDVAIVIGYRRVPLPPARMMPFKIYSPC